METIVRQDILELLKEALKLLSEENPNVNELKNLSNRTVHNASIFQDEDSISFAILMYSLSKVIERAGEYVDYDKLIASLSCAAKALEKDQGLQYRVCTAATFDIVRSTDGTYKQYIQDVMMQAAVKKGSAVYAHGISAARTAELLGISLWELQSYLSATEVPEDDVDATSVRQRLALTRRLFE